MLLQVLLTVAAILFCIGIYGVISRRNAVGVLLSLELMANAVNLNLISFALFNENGAVGQAFTLFAIALPVAEVVVGRARVVLLYRTRHNALLELASDLKR